MDKFEGIGQGGVSYADIAKRAWEVGRGRLATKVCFLVFLACSMLRMAWKLLDHENRASDQVPLLLSMKEDRLALIKAVDSGDTDLSMFSQRFKLFYLFAHYNSTSCSLAST